jgi:hypothetical protein
MTTSRGVLVALVLACLLAVALPAVEAKRPSFADLPWTKLLGINGKESGAHCVGCTLSTTPLASSSIPISSVFLAPFELNFFLLLKLFIIFALLGLNEHTTMIQQ